jgi:LCP family protein required for cell wall assembly
LPVVKYAVFHPWRTVIIVVSGVILGTAAFYAYTLNTALGAVAIEDFDPDQARVQIEASPVPSTTMPEIDLEIDEPGFTIEDEMDAIESTLGQQVDPREIHPTVFGEPIPDSVFESYLLVGSDASGFLADSIILALQPDEGGSPIMVSLPRDLFVWNLCRQRFTRLNTGLGGCPGSASGSELLAIMVEDYTGIPVDHLARINFDGFARMVDAMGGITVCVDRPSRDAKSHLEIEEPGCQRVGGETALAWVRSRHMEQLVGEEWVAVGGSDFGRQIRQQDVLFQLAGRAGSFSSPGSLVDRLSAVASYVRLDSSWSFAQAVSTGWKYRGISKSSVKRFSIDVRNHRSAQGAAVLLPNVTFTEQLSEVYALD